MKFFVDTAEIDANRRTERSGHGRRCNHQSFADSEIRSRHPGSDQEICDLVDGPVSAEVIATEVDNMIAEGRNLAKIARTLPSKYR